MIVGTPLSKNMNKLVILVKIYYSLLNLIFNSMLITFLLIDTLGSIKSHFYLEVNKFMNRVKSIR